jgi:hypothetical protein
MKSCILKVKYNEKYVIKIMHCTSNTAVFSINEYINCSHKVNADTIIGGSSHWTKIPRRRRDGAAALGTKVEAI